MNELDFKRHLKDLAHGHHHPEEHDWSANPPAPKPATSEKAAASRPTASRKTSKRK